MLGVAALASRPRLPSGAEEATLCRELRTPRLPVTHVPVGYCWQHNRSCHSDKCMTVTPATSCRTRTPQFSSRLTREKTSKPGEPPIDEVGRQRVTLAGTFPTAPSRTGQAPFSASGSPVARTSLVRRVARRAPHYAYPLTDRSSHLAPFAMWPAFPSADYFGASAPLGLASGRAFPRSAAPLTNRTV